ncbi:alpha/beta-hydrolase, partial [Coemansia reversa NRRL 1564]
LDIYFPQICPAMVPLVVYIHGGAWRTGDKADFSYIAEGLIGVAGHRLAVAVINYTLSTRLVGSIRHPGHLNEVIKAVKFLVTDQDYPGRSIVDSRRVFLVGHSAGAHMSALMALAPQPAFQYLGNIRGVVGVGGIYNIPKLLKSNPDYSDFIDMAF